MWVVRARVVHARVLTALVDLGGPSAARHSVRRDQVGVWQAAGVCARRDSSQQQAVRVCGRLAVCEWLMGVLRTLLWWQNADVVGKVDTVTDSFSTIGPLTGVPATAARFAGAAAVGTIVYFAPHVSLATLASRRVCPRACSSLCVGRVLTRAHGTCGSGR